MVLQNKKRKFGIGIAKLTSAVGFCHTVDTGQQGEGFWGGDVIRDNLRNLRPRRSNSRAKAFLPQMHADERG